MFALNVRLKNECEYLISLEKRKKSAGTKKRKKDESKSSNDNIWTKRNRQKCWFSDYVLNSTFFDDSMNIFLCSRKRGESRVTARRIDSVLFSFESLEKRRETLEWRSDLSFQKIARENVEQPDWGDRTDRLWTIHRRLSRQNRIGSAETFTRISDGRHRVRSNRTATPNNNSSDAGKRVKSS